jgi:autotransporter-associated beta strand protein
LNNINFVKKGAGTLWLTGNETYSGSTTVSGGTLVVNGGISGSYGGIQNTSGVCVTSGATLAGDGLVSVAQGGQVGIGGGAMIAPGDPAQDPPTGVLTISDPSGSPAAGGTFDLRSTGTLFISLDAYEAGGSQDAGNSGGGWDSQLVVSGNISLSGTLAGTLLNGFTANPGDLFFIIVNQGGNAVNGTFAGNPSTITLTGAGGTVTFNVGYTGDSSASPPSFTGGNDVVLEVTQTIPEPGSSGICLLALGLLIIRESRRRRHQPETYCIQRSPYGCPESRS